MAISVIPVRIPNAHSRPAVSNLLHYRVQEDIAWPSIEYFSSKALSLNVPFDLNSKRVGPVQVVTVDDEHGVVPCVGQD